MRFHDLGYDKPHQYGIDHKPIIRPPRDDAPLGWFWVILLVGVVACLCLFSCAAPTKRGPFEIIPPAPASPAYQLAAESRPTVFGLCAWSDAKSRELCARLGVTMPITSFINEPTPSRVVMCFGIAVATIYKLGHYQNDGCMIEVWMQDVNGVPIPEEQVKQTWRHEFVHHYDFCNGIPHPPGDHNELFEFRIRELDL